MVIRKVSCIYFSPTGTTKRIAERIVQGVGHDFSEMIDITKRFRRNTPPLFGEADLVILAAPVYYGRVPEEIVPYLRSLQAAGTPVALVAVYGNRAYDDALKELHDIAVDASFTPVAGGAFVAEHSYSSKASPIAGDRPDKNDLEEAYDFGGAIRKKLEKTESFRHLSPLTIPGQSPYVEPVNLNMIKQAREVVALTPETEASKCTQCGDCAEACPTGAISFDDLSQTDRWKCLICFACVRVCEEGARQMNEPNFQSAIQALQKNCLDRKSPEIFL